MFSFNISPGCCTIFIESFALLGICDKDRKPNQIYFRSALLTFLFLLKSGRSRIAGSSWFARPERRERWKGKIPLEFSLSSLVTGLSFLNRNYMDLVIPQRNLPEHRLHPLSVWLCVWAPSQAFHSCLTLGSPHHPCGALFTCLGSTSLPSPVTMSCTEGIYIFWQEYVHVICVHHCWWTESHVVESSLQSSLLVGGNGICPQYILWQHLYLKLLIVKREESDISKSLGQASWSFPWASSEFSCNVYHDVLMLCSLEFPNTIGQYIWCFPFTLHSFNFVGGCWMGWYMLGMCFPCAIRGDKLYKML